MRREAGREEWNRGIEKAATDIGRCGGRKELNSGRVKRVILAPTLQPARDKIRRGPALVTSLNLRPLGGRGGLSQMCV